MKNENISIQIKDCFGRIRKSVDRMQSNVLRQVKSASKEQEKYVEQYNANFLQQKKGELRERYNTSIWTCKESCRQTTDAEFSKIRSLLNDWMSVPVPMQCEALLLTFSRYNLKPTRKELETLTESAQGSYWGMRALSGLAKECGYYDVSFRPVESILKDLSEAQSEVNNSISNFCGYMDEKYHYTASQLLGLDITENINFSHIAERFLYDDDTVFANIEKELGEATETEFALLPSRRKEIERLFERCESERDRIDVVVNVIDREDTDLMDMLKVFDSALYEKALDEHAKLKLSAAVQASKKALDSAKADDAASKAAFDAVKKADSFRSGSATA